MKYEVMKHEKVEIKEEEKCERIWQLGGYFEKRKYMVICDFMSKVDSVLIEIKGTDMLEKTYEITKITCDNKIMEAVFNSILYNSNDKIDYLSIPDVYLELVYEVALTSNKKFIEQLLSKRKNLCIIGLIYNQIKDFQRSKIPCNIDVFQIIENEYLKDKSLIDYVLELNTILKNKSYSWDDNKGKENEVYGLMENFHHIGEKKYGVRKALKENDFVYLEIYTDYNDFKIKYNIKKEILELDGKIITVKKDVQKEFEDLKKELVSWINISVSQIVNVQRFDRPGGIIFYMKKNVDTYEKDTKSAGVWMYQVLFADCTSFDQKLSRLKNLVLFNLTRKIKENCTFAECSKNNLKEFVDCGEQIKENALLKIFVNYENAIKKTPWLKDNCFNVLLHSKLKAKIETENFGKYISDKCNLIVNDFLTENEMVLMPTVDNKHFFGTIFCSYQYYPVLNDGKDKLTAFNIRCGLKNVNEGCYRSILITD